jgi:hypothetical protein
MTAMLGVTPDSVKIWNGMGCFTATPTTTGMSACTKLPEIIRYTNPKAATCPNAAPQKRSHQEVRKRCSVKRKPLTSVIAAAT